MDMIASMALWRYPNCYIE